MRKSFLTVVCGLVLWGGSVGQSSAADLSAHFGDPKDGGYEGCFLVTDLSGEVILRSGEGCADRYPPCSTFKIPNSLIGLETGAVKRDTVFAWDGEKKYLRSWERDHDLASAIRYSVVWYYQELATRVGPEKMQQFLDRFDYGNRDMSGGLTRFWLGSTLEISADEQLRFMSKLYTDALPVSAESTEVVKDILRFKAGPDPKNPSWQLSAKTGSCWLDGGKSSLGWWVGHVSQGETERLFATRILGKGADGPEARKLTLKMMADPAIARSMGISPIEVSR